MKGENFMYQIKINNLHIGEQGQFVNKCAPLIQNNDFEYKNEGHLALLEYLIVYAANLNTHNMYAHIHYSPRIDYVHEQKKYLGAVVAVNAKTGESPVLLFDLQWENIGPCDEWNRKLRDRHGENLTLKIKSEVVAEDAFEDFDDDKEEIEGVPGYYYEGTSCGMSDYYRTPEEAYKRANEYMDNIELYVD